MKRVKKIVAAAVGFMIVFVNVISVNATDITIEPKAVYDMEKGGTQTFQIINEAGEESQITIEEISGQTKASNGSYKITCSTSNWTAGYYITISNNLITKAYSSFYTTVRGSITNGVLLRYTSGERAEYSFIYKLALFQFSTGVITEIIDNEIVVSQK